MKRNSDLINARLPVSIPEQLKAILVEKIKTGEYIPGEKIPSERDLSEIYGVSRISARQTLTEMIAADYLFRIPGRGTFVERADQIARKLQRGSFSVAFVINRSWYSFAQPGYGRILEGVERALRRRGYKVFFLTREDNGQVEQMSLDLKKRGEDGFGGYILVGPTQDDVIEYFKRAQVPFILLDAQTSLPGVNCVCMDYFDGAIQAVKYLVKLGHREIGYIGLEHSEKYRGYLEALHEARLKANPDYVEFISVDGEERPGFQHGKEAMQRLLQKNTLPTALHITNDVVVLGALEVLKREGLKVPDDISLIGCDDIDIYGQAEPPLTTVCTDLEDFGAVGVQRLFSLMENPQQTSQTIKVPLQLIIRGSAGPKIKTSNPVRIRKSLVRR